MIDREYPCFAYVPIRVASMFTFYRRPQNDAKKSRIRPQVNHGTEYGQIVMPHAIRCTNDIRAFKPTQAVDQSATFTSGQQLQIQLTDTTDATVQSQHLT